MCDKGCTVAKCTCRDPRVVLGNWTTRSLTLPDNVCPDTADALVWIQYEIRTQYDIEIVETPRTPVAFSRPKSQFSERGERNCERLIAQVTGIERDSCVTPQLIGEDVRIDNE